MAVTKTHPIKSTLKAAIDYILNPEKTDGKLLASSFGCGLETADIEFAWTREAAGDRGTHLGRHLIQSFAVGETTPEEAHKIGMELAGAVLGGKYEFVLTTHVDKDHLHNHLIFNAVSFVDYKKYHSNKQSYHFIRRTSDRICKEHGLSVVVPGQDKTVKLIYRLFLDGYTFHSIARELTSRGLETPARKKRWYPGTVESILTNEKYKGDALLQKRFTVNFLTKETKANEGEVPQYYVENNHEAIISPQVFDWVQEEIKRRREGRGRYSGVSIFSSKIKCGQCGGWYGAKVWHSTDKYRRTIYRCNDKFKSHCKTPHLTEDDIKEAFVRAVNQLIENKADVLDSITLLKERLTDTEDLEEERDRISTDLNLLADKIQQLIAENARVAQNQDDYDRNYNELVSRYEAAKTQYDKTCEAIQYRKARSRQMDSFIKELRNQDLIKEFDARLWGSLVDFITVYSKDDIRVTFKDGTEIRA